MKNSFFLIALIGLVSLLIFGCGNNAPRRPISPENIKNLSQPEIKIILENLIKSEKLTAIYNLPSHDPISESHAGGSGQGNNRSPNTKNNFNKCSEISGQISTTKHLFYVTLPDSMVNSEGNITAEFKIFKDNDNINPDGIDIALLGENSSPKRTISGNRINVNTSDYQSGDNNMDYVNFEVTTRLNDDDMEKYHIVMEILDHHQRNVTVVFEPNGQYYINLNSTLILPYPLLGLNGLERYRGLDNPDSGHRSEHIVIQDFKCFSPIK